MAIPRRTWEWAIAVAAMLLVAPGALFMAAALIRQLQPPSHQPARTAQQLVMWCAGRRWTLWVFLITLPLAALASGAATLRIRWKEDTGLRAATRRTIAAVPARLPLLLIAAVTLAAAGILAIVILHMLSD